MCAHSRSFGILDPTLIFFPPFFCFERSPVLPAARGSSAARVLRRSAWVAPPARNPRLHVSLTSSRLPRSRTAPRRSSPVDDEVHRRPDHQRSCRPPQRNQRPHIQSRYTAKLHEAAVRHRSRARNSPPLRYIVHHASSPAAATCAEPVQRNRPTAKLLTP